MQKRWWARGRVSMLTVAGVVAALSGSQSAGAAPPSAALSAPVAVDPTPQALPGSGAELRVASSGGEALAVYGTDRAVLGRRIATNGEPLGDPFAIGNG